MVQALNALLRSVRQATYEYFKDNSEHRREFEEWYFCKYGKKYEWEKDSEQQKNG